MKKTGRRERQADNGEGERRGEGGITRGGLKKVNTKMKQMINKEKLEGEEKVINVSWKKKSVIEVLLFT